MLFSLNNFTDALDKVKVSPFICSASNRLCFFSVLGMLITIRNNDVHVYGCVCVCACIFAQ